MFKRRDQRYGKHGGCLLNFYLDAANNLRPAPRRHGSCASVKRGKEKRKKKQVNVHCVSQRLILEPRTKNQQLDQWISFAGIDESIFRRVYRVSFYRVPSTISITCFHVVEYTRFFLLTNLIKKIPILPNVEFTTFENFAYKI